jgi:hypothetical protein
MFHVTERVMSTYHWIASGHKQFNEIIHGSEEKDSKLIKWKIQGALLAYVLPQGTTQPQPLIYIPWHHGHLFLAKGLID